MEERRDARSSPIDVGLDQDSEATKDDTCKGLCLRCLNEGVFRTLRSRWRIRGGWFGNFRCLNEGVFGTDFRSGLSRAVACDERKCHNSDSNKWKSHSSSYLAIAALLR